jgi:uncharacterized membrane protein (DUF2068 family)
MHNIRPQTVTVAAILMALFSLMNFPGPWWYAIPGAVEATPMFVIYVGIVLGIAGLVAAVGLWMLKKWGWWSTIIVSVLNILFNVPAPAMVPTTALLVAIAVQTIGFIVTIVLVVLPSARRALAASSS